MDSGFELHVGILYISSNKSPSLVRLSRGRVLYDVLHVVVLEPDSV